MAPVMKLLGKIPQTWHGIAIVVVILGVGWSANALFGQASKLPDRVSDLEAVTRRHTTEIESIRGNAGQLEKKVDRVLCYAESQAGIRPVSECIR